MPRSMITRLSIQALFIGLLTTQAVQAQKDASAILQLDSTTQGMLPPRMTTTQRDAIATPAQGLVIYNTDTNFYNYWNSTSWIPLSAGGSNTLIDADSDTQIQVEESADEDVIRFDTAGIQRASIDGNGIHGVLADADGDTQIQVEESTDEDKIRFDVAGTQRMVIHKPANNYDLSVDVNGYFRAKNYFFTAHDVSVNSNAPTDTGFRAWTFTERYDPAGIFNGITFTAPENGYYEFYCSITFYNGNGGDDSAQLDIRKGSSHFARVWINPRKDTSSTTEQSYSVSGIVYLAAGNTVQAGITNLDHTSLKYRTKMFTGKMISRQ